MGKASKITTACVIALILISAVTFIYSGRCIKWAIDKNQIVLLDKFLWMGAPVDSDFGAYGNPIIHAVSSRKIDAIHVLANHGADVNIYPFRDLSLLAWAYSVAQGPEIGEALISVGAHVDSLAVPSSQKTVLMYLLNYNALDIRKISSVIKHRPDLHIRDIQGKSSVDYILKREGELRALGWRDEYGIISTPQLTPTTVGVIDSAPESQTKNRLTTHDQN